ncbi:hypothetical protein [Priestia endophytica]|uniref:hypothetical protein n=1 Tax=Priestia endophytica TaxID=135735 RepID=UPI000F534BC5|nr:hypothetical protein [Priestia endophytica]
MNIINKGKEYTKLMKNIFTPKLLTSLACIVIIIGFYFEQTRENTVLITGLLFGGWLAITLHELGHVMFGKLVGFEFILFTTGPIQVEKTSKGIALRENRNWTNIGGIAVMMPPSVEKKEMINKQILYSAGGPILSLLVGLIGIILYKQIEHVILLSFAIMNLGILVVTMIPMGKGGIGSDGYFILSLIKRNQKSLELMDEMLISKELLSSKKPSEWNIEYIKLAREKKPSADNVLYGMMIYYLEIEQNGFQSAKEKMSGYTSIPVTKQNKRALGTFIHMEQLSAFLMRDGEKQLLKVRELQEWLSPIEPISFYRGQAMIAHLQNKNLQALKNIKKAKEIIEKNEKTYGFLRVEKVLTNMVEELILSNTCYKQEDETKVN